MKYLALVIALVLSTAAMAHEGGGNGGEKVFAKMYQANQDAIARQGASHSHQPNPDRG